MNIRKVDDPILRKVCQPVTVFDDHLSATVKEMIELMIDSNGIGLAAPQVGIDAKLFIADIKSVKYKDGVFVAINPKIEKDKKDKKAEGVEGCLSIPGYQCIVSRAKKIKITAQDVTGQTFTEEFINTDARVLQHEFDHLMGILMIDRAKNNLGKLQALRKPIQ